MPTQYSGVGDVNARGNLGETALYEAAFANNLVLAKDLLAKGADPNIMTTQGMYPLTVAIWKGYTEMVRILIDAGANPNVIYPTYKSTPIIMCGAYGNAEIARILLDAGADVNALDYKNKTVVDYALEYKKDEVLAVLRKEGVPVSYSGDSAKDIVMAILSEDREKVRSLLEGGVDPNAKTKAGKSLLAYAVGLKWPDIVELLIRKGADVSVKDETGWTVIMTAALENQAEIVQAFEKAGVNPPYIGEAKRDILVAVLFSDKDKVKALISEGADANSRHRYNSPLLNYAAYKNDRAMIELLLDKGANLNVVNEQGWGPLSIVINKGGPSMGRLLIERGATVGGRDARGISVLDVAIRTGDTAFVQYVLEHGAQADIASVLLSQGKVSGYQNVNYPEIAALLRPEILRRQMLRAEAAVEAAQSPADYQKAIAEYGMAKELAPELPEIYYNLGLVQDKAGFYADAIQSLKKYLELSPNASDFKAVQDMIYKWEYKRDQGNR